MKNLNIYPPLSDNSSCPIRGEYQGVKMVEVPAKYLLWLWDQTWLENKYPTVANYIAENIDYLEQEIENN